MAQWIENRPSEDFYQILDPNGQIINELINIGEEVLLRMYRTMVEAREFDEKTLAMQRRGEVSIIARSTGEEVVSTGSAAALEEGDWCFPSYKQLSPLSVERCKESYR